MPDAVAKALFTNRWFTLTYQTRFVAALQCRERFRRGRLRPDGSRGPRASARRSSLSRVPRCCRQWHANSKVSAILTDSRALVATAAGGETRALLPLDWLPWTATSHSALADAAGRARKELRATRLEIRLSGRATERASKENRPSGLDDSPCRRKEVKK